MGLKILEKVCEKTRFDGLTVNILDKCRQGLNLFSKRSNALCGTQLQSLKHPSLPITFQKYRKRLVILRLFGKKNSIEASKNFVGDQPRLFLCALSRTISFNVAVLRVEHAQVGGLSLIHI